MKHELVLALLPEMYKHHDEISRKLTNGEYFQSMFQYMNSTHAKEMSESLLRVARFMHDEKLNFVRRRKMSEIEKIEFLEKFNELEANVRNLGVFFSKRQGELIEKEKLAEKAKDNPHPDEPPGWGLLSHAGRDGTRRIQEEAR